ncbi:response regulator transcription factor [Aquimarina macrocephali]|uniref:response regulator transcription factor n=1 Tax=Aquimarina macrocephali TaxID=666563 RepID=UPI000466C555|nr:helix-turn-helix transcriptional regulator [Aquimarina macrocephali]
MKSRHLVYIILFFSGQLIFAQYEISGQLSNYDKLWHDKIYMAYIEPGEDYNIASSRQIINSTTLDMDGNFIFKGNNLPPGNSVVRIYLVENEKIDVMLSYKPKNHILLILNDKSKIHIESSDFSTNPLDYIITGDFEKQNNKIKELELSLYNLNNQDSSPYLKSEKGQKLIAKKRKNIIKEFCKSNTYPLVIIFAVQKLNIEKEYSNDSDFYKELLFKLKKSNEETFAYVEAFSKKIDVIGYKVNKNESKVDKYNFSLLKDIAIILLCLFVIILIVYIFSLKKKITSISSTHIQSEKYEFTDYNQLIKSLTRREKEILELIIQEYQNKEIAIQLHLEVSTIKSHLSKIYTKLNVKNRNELKILLAS